MEILRKRELRELQARFEQFPIVAILGPRQCGKTTLAKQFSNSLAGSKVTFFDLERPADLAKLDNPSLNLEPLQGLVIIDEIQRKPELFPFLRVLADQKRVKYLILGSTSPHLIKQSSESLAGRVSYLELHGFSLSLMPKSMSNLWLRGGFPPSFLAKTNAHSFLWREDFITTFLEKDIPNLGIHIPAKSLRRFWMMLSHYHGQIFNASEIGRSLQVSDSTAQRYLDILSGTYMIRQLQPWFYNTKKRIVKRPKLYFRDSGLLHALMAIHTQEQLSAHPQLGASWEGFALEQLIDQFQWREENCFFWSLHSGAQLDLVIPSRGKLLGFEFKYQDAPHLTPSMKSALSELDLEHLYVIYPGKEHYRLETKISAVPVSDLSSGVKS